MERRAFLKNTVAGVSVFAGLKTVDATGEPAVEIAATTKDLIVPADGYEAPGWLRYARAIYFEGFTPPLYPHLDEFDAERLVKVVQELGGDTPPTTRPAPRPSIARSSSPTATALPCGYRT